MLRREEQDEGRSGKGLEGAEGSRRLMDKGAFIRLSPKDIDSERTHAVKQALYGRVVFFPLVPAFTMRKRRKFPGGEIACCCTIQ